MLKFYLTVHLEQPWINLSLTQYEINLLFYFELVKTVLWKIVAKNSRFSIWCRSTKFLPSVIVFIFSIQLNRANFGV